MWHIERTDKEGNWHPMMLGPHRLKISDLRGPPGPPTGNQFTGAHYMNGWPSPGNLTEFAGKPGIQARVRYNDTVVELYDWGKVPVNPADPESDTLWGWKLIEQNHAQVPFEQLWPLSFIG